MLRLGELILELLGSISGVGWVGEARKVVARGVVKSFIFKTNLGVARRRVQNVIVEAGSILSAKRVARRGRSFDTVSERIRVLFCANITADLLFALTTL